MKKLIYILLTALCVSMVFGCKKFLVEKTFTNLNETVFPKTESDLRVLCNGLYNLFEANEHYGRSYIILSDVFSDELTTTQLSGPRYETQNFVVTPGNTEVTQAWTRNYIVISRANNIIQNAPLIGLPDAKTQPYVAEARFIRALCYFELVKFFGDVPLVLSQPQNLDSLQVLKPKRALQKDVYNQIVSDFKYAELYLRKENQIPVDQKGIASTGAASALLAKVYLTRAYQSFAESTDFQNAADQCTKVISSGSYNLFSNYKDVFDINKENGIEHIFSIQYDQAPNRSGGMCGFLVPSQVYPYDFGSFPAERKFYDSFPAADTVRKKYVFYDQGTGLRGNAYNFITSPVSMPYCAKYRDDALAAVGFADRCNYLIIRYADVLLMQSEALNKINPANSDKYTGINLVRARAKLAPLSGLNQTDFETAVLDERHWEFCFEGKRRDDLIRMGKLVPVMKALGFANIQESQKLYPIPQSEIDINKNLLPQNAGY